MKILHFVIWHKYILQFDTNTIPAQVKSLGPRGMYFPMHPDSIQSSVSQHCIEYFFKAGFSLRFQQFWVRRVPLWWSATTICRLAATTFLIKISSFNLPMLLGIFGIRLKYNQGWKHGSSMKTGEQFVTLWNLFWASFKQCFETWQRSSDEWLRGNHPISNFYLGYPSICTSRGGEICTSRGRRENMHLLQCRRKYAPLVMEEKLCTSCSGFSMEDKEMKSPVSRCTLLELRAWNRITIREDFG